ncbi:hypothetical protein TNCV_2916011 [Trichonephila clavipes]|nr:hypothetical protein TNCV_2916011 [Trichonephila clavipes]
MLLLISTRFSFNQGRASHSGRPLNAPRSPPTADHGSHRVKTWGTQKRRQAASPLVRLVEERCEVHDHPQGVLPKNMVGTDPNRIVTFMVLKVTDSDRRKLLPPSHDEFHRQTGDIRNNNNKFVE